MKFFHKFVNYKDQILIQKYKVLLNMFSEESEKPKINQDHLVSLFTKLEVERHTHNPDFIVTMFRSECDQL